MLSPMVGFNHPLPSRAYARQSTGLHAREKVVREVPLRFAGGYISQAASNIVAHLERDRSWGKSNSSVHQNLRTLLFDGLAILYRADGLMGEEVLRQFADHFPYTHLSPSQSSTGMEGLEFVVTQRGEELPKISDKNLLEEKVAAAKQLTLPGSRVTGAQAVTQALDIMLDIVSDEKAWKLE